MSRSRVATRYTFEFVRQNLPADAKSVLEIGCGQGELAKRLTRDALEVVAIDNDEAAVATARELGVDARLETWPADLGLRFDAVLFTRSLHHIEKLDEAIAAAERALRPGGRVIVEDFRAEGGTGRSSEWYLAMVRKLLDGGLAEEDTDAEALLGKIAPPDSQEHELHSSAAIESALVRQFEVTASDAAYYFRYLEPHVRQEGTARFLLDAELERMAAGDIDPLGKRFVASRR